jgi:hypothetical protein
MTFLQLSGVLDLLWLQYWNTFEQRLRVDDTIERTGAQCWSIATDALSRSSRRDVVATTIQCRFGDD